MQHCAARTVLIEDAGTVTQQPIKCLEMESANGEHDDIVL